MNRCAASRLSLLTLLSAAMAAPGCYTGKLDYGVSSGADGAGHEDGDGGSAGDDGGDDGPQAQCEVPAARVWKLTPRQHDNSVHAIFDDAEAAQTLLEALLPFDARHFHNEADHSDMPVAYVTQVFNHAERTAALVADDPGLVDPCLVQAGVGDDTCLSAALDSLLRTAYRRPPTASELATLTDFIRDRAASDGDAVALGDAIAAVLTSPSFLYRTELGAVDDDSEIFELDAYEKASALSYFLLNGPPDQQLLAAASSGDLDAPGQIEAHTRRLLEDPSASEGILRFFAEYTQTYRVTSVGKSVPEFDDALARDMETEVTAFVAEVLGDEDGTFRTLLTAPYSVVSPRLAALYGVEIDGEDWTRVDFAPNERAGILTQAAVLTTFGYPDHGDPVSRGRFIRERLLCQPLPPPPPDIPSIPEDDDEDKTMRERLERHFEDPACFGCHQFMDPLGLPLERYDVLGRFRLLEGNLEIDPSGELYGLGDVVPFDDAIEMAHVLADHPVTQQCFIDSLFFYAYGRPPAQGDACEIERLTRTFEETEGNIVELLIDTVTSEHFTHRRRAR
jgi:hypothetical protein